jgi:hypothetical protein
MDHRASLEKFSFLRETPVKAVFATQITASRQATENWLPGLLFTLGYTWPKEEPNPVPMILLDKVECSRNAALIRDGLKLIITINQSDLAPVLPASVYLVARATISPSGRAFEGEVSSRGDDPTGAPPYGWKGTMQTMLGAPAAHDDAISVIRALTSWRHDNGLG